MSILIRKHHLISLVFIFITFVLIITVFISNDQKKLYHSKADENITSTPEASPSAQIALLETMIESKNIETNNLLNKYEQTTDEGEKQNLVSSLENNLTERKNNQLSLLKLSPKAVYNKSFDKDKIDKLNNIATNVKDKHLVEERIDTITGIVNTTIYDNFDNNTSYTTSIFIPDNNAEQEQLQEINFYPADHQTFLSGTKTTLNDAIRINENKQVFGVSSSIYAQEQQPQEQGQDKQPQSHLVAVDIQTIETPPLDTLGEQKILVLLAKAKDGDESRLSTPQEIEDIMNKTFKPFYEKASYNKMIINTDVVKKWYVTKFMRSSVEQDIIPVITQAFDDMLNRVIDIHDYQRIVLLGARVSQYTGSDAMPEPRVLGRSSLGKNRKIKLNKTNSGWSDIELNVSISITYGVDSKLVVDSGWFKRKNQDGQFNMTEFLAIHMLGHGLGIQDARSTSCEEKNIFLSMVECLNSPGGTPLDYERWETIANPFDVMGIANEDFRFNLYTQRALGWLGDNQTVSAIVVDPDMPYGRYTIKRMGAQGTIGAFVPFNHNPYYFEYRKGKDNPGISLRSPLRQEKGLVINIPFFDSDNLVKYYSKETQTSSDRYVEMGGIHQGYDKDTGRSALKPTYLLEYVNQISRQTHSVVPKGGSIIFAYDNMRIKVLNFNELEDSLTFAIEPCKGEFNFLLQNGGSKENTASVNIFEDDLRKQDKFQYNVGVENQSCFNKYYYFHRGESVITQGSLHIAEVRYQKEATATLSPEPPTFASSLIFDVNLEFNNPTLSDAQLDSTVIEEFSDKEKLSYIAFPRDKKFVHQFHFVPSIEEYNTDLEPSLIEIKDPNATEFSTVFIPPDQIPIEPDFDHLWLKMGQTVIFTSNIKNNSRNTNGNKTPDFFVEWLIEDKKGRNITIKALPGKKDETRNPVQYHVGIPPKSIDDAHPAILTWTIPNDLPAGVYRIVLKVDYNNKLKKEFNENNNMMWRYFVVE